MFRIKFRNWTFDCRKEFSVVLTDQNRQPCAVMGIGGAGIPGADQPMGFVDADDEIAEAANMSIPEIFDQFGEAYVWTPPPSLSPYPPPLMDMLYVLISSGTCESSATCRSRPTCTPWWRRRPT